MSPPEFYHQDVTERSWILLQHLQSTYPFVLIGGWAAWCYAQAEKSRDIDIVIDYATLGRLRADYPSVVRNDRLRKYEIPAEGFDVDIYVLHFSTTLTVPTEYLLAHAQVVQGFRVPSPEALIVLKAGAWLEQRQSLHGEKDRQDLLHLLPHCRASDLRKLADSAGLTEAQRATADAALNALLPTVPARQREAFLEGLSQWNPGSPGQSPRL